MTWSVRGRSLELCNCRMFCPCWLTAEGEPDQGWCGGVLAFEVVDGASDGVDLSGGKAEASIDWPGNFWAGGGTGRLYVDDRADAAQRRELEAIFGGRKGGPLGNVLPTVVTTWLPTEFTDITVHWDEPTSLRVGRFGEATLSRLRDGAGQTTTVQGAAALTAFGMTTMELASSKGSGWHDPDLREWEGDSGTLHDFTWSE